MMSKVLVLLGLEIFLVLIIIIQLRKLGRLDSAKLLSLILFLIAFPLSGIAHLTSGRLLFRGYFDLIPFLGSALPMETALLSFAVAISLSLSVFIQPDVQSDKSIFSKQRINSSITINIFVLSLIPLSILALKKIEGYLIDSKINRVLYLDGGLARYFYVAIWIVWPILLCGIFMLQARTNQFENYSILVIILLFSSILFISLSWTGSRLLPLLFTYVLSQFAGPLGRKVSRVIKILAPVVVLLYIYVTTLNRVSALSYGKNSFEFASLLDWQIGRFSILGATLKYNSEEGLLQGSTFISTLSQAFLGIIRLLGLSVGDAGNGQLSISQEFGLVVYSNSDNRFLAPSLLIEFFRNFGISGLLVYSMILPFIVTFLYRTSRNHPDIFIRILTSYYTLSFLFVSFLSSSESLIGYFVYYPLPIISIIILRKFVFGNGEEYARLRSDN